MEVVSLKNRGRKGELSGRRERLIRKRKRGEIRSKGERQKEPHRGKRRSVKMCEVCSKLKNKKKLRRDPIRGHVCKSHHTV